MTNHEEHVFRRFSFSDIADDILLGIGAIHPFKPVRMRIALLKSALSSVQVIQFAHQEAQSRVCFEVQ